MKEIIKQPFYKCLCFLFLCSYLSSCNEEKDNKIQYYNNGNIKSIDIKHNEKKATIFFDSSGNLEKISRFKNDSFDGEQLTFSKTNLIEKTTFLNGKENGHYYDFFYPSGAIKSHRYVINGKEQGLGTEYYDQQAEVLKNSFYFNIDGDIYFKQYYDSTGKLYKEEGKR